MSRFWALTNCAVAMAARPDNEIALANGSELFRTRRAATLLGRAKGISQKILAWTIAQAGDYFGLACALLAATTVIIFAAISFAS